MYDKKLIKKLVKKYERKAGVSLMLYQETGNEKHERISEEAEVIAAALRVMLVDAERDEEHQQTYVLWWVSPSGQYYKYGEYESLKMAVQAYRYCRQAYAGFEPILKRLTSEDITEMLQKEHPPKTMLQDFLEKYPNAPLNINGDYPECCPFMLGYKKGDCIKPRGTCVECWNRPVE